MSPDKPQKLSNSRISEGSKPQKVASNTINIDKYCNLSPDFNQYSLLGGFANVNPSVQNKIPLKNTIKKTKKGHQNVEKRPKMDGFKDLKKMEIESNPK